MMKSAFFTVLSIVLLVLILSTGTPMETEARTIYKFGGGPPGGTFQIIAGSITNYPPISMIREFRVLTEVSGGSVENLQRVHSGEDAMGLVYASHLYLGRNGRIEGDPTRYETVLAVAALYNAPAQLVVRKDNRIKKLPDLVGKKVGVGNEGSGAMLTCRLFFISMGLWDAIDAHPMGYNTAAVAFSQKQVDAFWIFAAAPNGAVAMAASRDVIDLVDLDITDTDFYRAHPYFSKTIIPAGTYAGINRNVPSFQDTALWVAGKHVSPDVVYTLLKKIYTPEGLAYMIRMKSASRSMGLENGIDGIITPLHPGAEKFWKEKGVIRSSPETKKS